MEEKCESRGKRNQRLQNNEHGQLSNSAEAWTAAAESGILQKFAIRYSYYALARAQPAPKGTKLSEQEAKSLGKLTFFAKFLASGNHFFVTLS